MAKRTAFEANAKAARSDRQPKRQKFDEPTFTRDSPQASAEEVISARQLQNALIFDQGSASGFRTGLTLLKRFVDSILYSADEHDLPRKRAILRDYLESQQGKKGDKDNFLQNFIQAWDYAAESNFEPLLAQVTATLALLFKAVASHVDLLEYGSLLSRTILQPSVARRLVRSLTAATNKENVIAPALRLLTDITKFNEGAQAKVVYLRKDFTLEPKILARNIGLWKESKDQSAVDLQRKPSVRTTAVRYLLTHLKYQDETVKSEILSSTQVTRALLDNLHTDPPYLIYEIFDVLKNHVFLDKAIPRSVKSRMLNGRALSHIASLYRYEVTDGLLSEGQKAPDELAHDFLRLICTSPAYGIMLPTSGLYPPQDEDEDGDVRAEDAADYDFDFGLDSNEKKVRIRNVILADFIQTLRPYSNTLQQELVLSIFNACPELVADYFYKKEDFNYDPKLTSTWIGFSAFLYETIELRVPEHFGARKGYRDYPPPISTMMPGILPQPLTQQVLTRCLNHSADLIQFFAVRVLIVAFQKLRSVLQEFKKANLAKPSKLWEQASKRLTTDFSKRCPPMKTVMLAFKTPAFQQKTMKREAITRLLRLYYEVTPQVALQEKFDVSLPLCNALTQVERSAETSEDKVLRVMELEHWIQMARLSPSMRWWQKNKNLQHSPFLTLVKLVVTSAESELYSGIKDLLLAILRDQEMLQMATQPNALDALIASLSASLGSSSPSREVLEFLDDCCARFVKAPIKYFDDLDAIRSRCSQTASDSGPFSPLLMTLVEQWPFKGGKPEKGNPAEPLAQWLARVLYLFKLIGEDEALLVQVRDSLVESADKSYEDVLKDAFLWKMGKEKAKEALKLATGADFSSGSERSSISPTPPEQPQEPIKPIPTVDLELPPKEDEKHAGLNRWRKKELEESIDDGDVGELMLCLCSKYAEIRLQAVNNIRQLMAATNTDSEFFQHKVLLGEILETAGPRVASKPLPYVGGVLAARCVSVLADPTHFMFAKINKFLTERPDWPIENLPRKFTREIIHHEPDEDGSYHKEVDWLLDYFIDGLRTPEDMEIFRTNNAIERLLSFYSSKSCSIPAKEKIIRLLFRAAAVGGSTTLITRCGLVSWIQMMDDLNDHRRRTLKQLAARVYETCDQDKVAEWSSGTMKQPLAST